MRVRERDNLTKIAARELGDGDRWLEIAELNRVPRPYHVRVGQLLYLPGERAAAQASEATAANERTSPSPAPAGATPSTYKVKAGDTPGEISQAVYGTSKHWKSILAANGIPNARGLQVGAVLKIPPRAD